MSSKAEILVDPRTGEREQTWNGFSWPCLFFGVLWFVNKRLWMAALIALFGCLLTSGIVWLLLPFFANSLHRNHLQKKGWLSEVIAAEYVVSPETHVRCPDCKELVRKEARVCKHCGIRLIPQP